MTKVFSLICLFLICGLSSSQQVVTPEDFIINGDQVLLIKGRAGNDLKIWLAIEAINGKDWKENGFDRSFTRVYSDFKPLFRKLPSGTWEICFVGE